MATKNLGQVSGVAIQNTPPNNTALIWYDNTPSQMCHKVYDTAKQQWVIIDQKIISLITYSEIENLARQSGLPLGKFYQITDRNNALAVAIASTKVQYADALGNILIDDLGTNIQYHVSSSNLQIDGIVGKFNDTKSKLVFEFEELGTEFDNDYILGKTKRNNVWTLFKFKLKSLVSSETGNSITWNNGLFLNIQNIIKGLKDKVGGFVSFERFTQTIETQNTAINNVGKENQNIIQNAHNELMENASDTAVYNKKLPLELETGGEPVDMSKGNTLIQCLSKIQRYINRFKYATGIRLSPDFSANKATGDVNNNDTVESAIAKLSRVSHSAGVLSNYSNTVKGNVASGDTVEEAFSKVENQVKDVENDLSDSITQINKDINAAETACKKYTDDELKAACAGVYPLENDESLNTSVSYSIPQKYRNLIKIGDIVRLCASVKVAGQSSIVKNSAVVSVDFLITKLDGTITSGTHLIAGPNNSANRTNTVLMLYTSYYSVDEGTLSLAISREGDEYTPSIDFGDTNSYFILFKKSKNVS